MTLRRSQVAVVTVVALAALWMAGLTFGLSWMYRQKVTALVGQTRRVVEHELGPPTRDWGSADFQCAEDFPCGGGALGGPVFLYAEGRRGYYLYFDRSEELVAVQTAAKR